MGHGIFAGLRPARQKQPQVLRLAALAQNDSIVAMTAFLRFKALGLDPSHHGENPP
jgi:hypothetical protein